jgi:hypothetical protein
MAPRLLQVAETVHALELAIYRCEVSLEKAEYALLNLSESDSWSIDVLLRAGGQVMINNFHFGALMYVMMNRN